MNPDAALALPEVTEQLVRSQNLQADTANKLLQANGVRYGALGSGFSAMVSRAEEEAEQKVNLFNQGPGFGIKTKGTPGISLKELTNTLQQFVGENGLLDAKDTIPIITAASKMTDAERFKYAKNFAISSLGASDALTKTYGAINAQNAGGSTAFRQTAPMTGISRNVGENLDHTPTTAELNASQPGVNARGEPTAGTAAQARPFFSGSGKQIPGTGEESNVTGLSPQESQLQTERAKTSNEYESALNESNTTGQENLRVLREMQDAMKEFKTGGGMEVRQRLAQLAQGVGMPQRLVDDIAGGNRGAVAEFQKLAVRYATQEMKTNMGTAQRFTNLDFATFLKNNPTIDTDPRGLEKMYGFLEKGIWRMGQQQEYYNRWKQGERPAAYKNAGMDAFPAFWTKVLSKASAPAAATTNGTP